MTKTTGTYKGFLASATAVPNGLRPELEKTAVLDDKHTVAATDGYRLHAVVDCPIRKSEGNEKRAFAFWNVIETLSTKPTATILIDARLLMDTLSHFVDNGVACPVQISISDRHIEIAGTLLDDSSARAYIMAMVAKSFDAWKPSRVKP
jgi:hypothetical protein